MVRVPPWEGIDWLRHGFSSRAGGVSTAYGPAELNLGYTNDDVRDAVVRNRELLVQAVMPGAGLAMVRQVHGVDVLRVESGGLAGDADGLVTALPGFLLGVQAADCVPLLLVDLRLRVVAALHAGWRGTAAEMARAGVQAMQREFGTRAEDVEAAVGPAIGPCCYTVGEEVAQRLPGEIARVGQELRLDLWAANRRQMEEAGVRTVHVVGECTACTRTEDGRRKYFSHRAEHGFTGRAMGVVGVVGSLRNADKEPGKLF